MALEEQLKKERGWYLGEATEEAAQSVLQRCSLFNVFVVYNKPDSTEYTLATRVRMKDSEEDTFEHLQISHTEEGLYQLSGQVEAKEDIVAVVDSYTTGKHPPLIPALPYLRAAHSCCSTELCKYYCEECLFCPVRCAFQCFLFCFMRYDDD